MLKSKSYPIFTTQGIRASAEAEEPFVVVLDMGSNALFGRVTNAFGDMVAGAEVSLDWKHVESGVQHYSDRKTTADHNGKFAFNELGPGVHTLRVNAPGFSMAVININIGTDPGNMVVELEEES